MITNNALSTVASFATLKSMIDAKEYKDQYEILADFIQYAIDDKKTQSFTALKMKNLVMELFGLDIPEAVIKTSIKKLKDITVINKVYHVDSHNSSLSNNNFKAIKVSSEDGFSEVLYKLKLYIRERNPHIEINDEQLTGEFISFLIDEDNKFNGEKFISLIGEFVVKFENDQSIQRILNAVREGSIIYIGLNYNINNIGNIKKDLKLFLATEVLFSLSGFNGTMHAQLAKDFYSQIQEINKKKKRIHLRYFQDVRKEIEDFFFAAKMIRNKQMIAHEDTVAMNSILEGCSSETDIDIKEADFFQNLKIQYGIIEDEKEIYYREEDSPYNLEVMQSDGQENYLKYISHINKLRKGITCEDNLDSGYLLVTNSYNILRASKRKTDELRERLGNRKVCDYALSLDAMTNLLWYKLGNLFGKKEFPCNVSAVLKARTLLSAHITFNVSKLYKETIQLYRKGAISVETLNARIATIKRKPILPEELNSEEIEETMDFSPEMIMKYEEEVASDKRSLELAKEEILKYKDDSHQKDIKLENEKQKNKKLEQIIAQFEDDKNARERRKKLVKKWVLYISKILVLLAFLVLLIYGFSFLIPILGNDVVATLSILSGILGIFPIYGKLKSDYNKCFGEVPDTYTNDNK